MPLIGPPIPPPADPPVGGPRDVAVPAVDTVGDRESGRNRSGERRRKRRALLDLLMQEVEAIPELAPQHKETIRRNIREFVRTETIRRPPRQEGEIQAAPPAIAAAQSASQPVPTPEEPVSGPVLKAVLRIPTAEQQMRMEEMARLEAEFRRCLSLHTEPARKIANYIHALQILEEAPHLVSIET